MYHYGRITLVLAITVCLFATAAMPIEYPLPEKPETLKTSSHVLQNPGFPDGREGGETIATAIVIPYLPYNDFGNTSDNVDDYEEACPHDSTSPDVVYAFTPPTDVTIIADLCGSGYDTKIFIYDVNMTVIACNDDYYYDAQDPCGQWASKLANISLAGGQTYYIVIDGWGGDAGDYQLGVTETVPCDIACQGIPEDEPELVDNYVDSFNGGCSQDPPAVVWLEGQGDGCVTMCGVSGWYNSPDGVARDMDYYRVNCTGDVLEINVDAESPSRVYLINGWCNDPIIESWPVGPCNPLSRSYPTNPNRDVVIMIVPNSWQTPGDTFQWSLNVCGIINGTVIVEETTWDDLKAMYK